MILTFFRRLATAALVLAGSAAASHAQQAEARFAFVIGNDGYAQGALPTAANDAALVADALRVAGFDVTGARNLDQDTFRASYREFLAKVAAAGPTAVATVYLSGHGLQFEGENFFLPVGAAIQRDSDIGLNAIRISDLTRPLAGLNGRASLMMLDLAYDTPVKLEQPLAPGLALVEAETGMLLAFNAAPGMLAPATKLPYGPYAQAISEMIRIGNLNADEMMDRVRMRVVELTQNRQVPWHQSKISPPLILLERGADAPAPQVSRTNVERLQTASIKELGPRDGYAAVLKRDSITDYQAYIEAYPDARETRRVRAMLAARREALVWSRTTARHTPNAYWTYLKQYPRGPHAADARRRLARLSQPIEAPADFDIVDYGIAPPPADELVYFAGDAPRYFDDREEIVIIDDYAPPPRWWSPPPPPVYDEEEDYYLPAPIVREPRPVWVAPPSYVAEPVLPYAAPAPGGGGTLQSVAPYIAIPAALAAGIAAGKLISNRDRRATRPGGAPPNVAPAPGGIPGGLNPRDGGPRGGQQLQPGGAPNAALDAQRPQRAMPPVSLPPGQTHVLPGTRINAPDAGRGGRPPLPGAIQQPGQQQGTQQGQQQGTQPAVPPAQRPPVATVPPVPAPGATQVLPGATQGSPGPTAPRTQQPQRPAGLPFVTAPNAAPAAQAPNPATPNTGAQAPGTLPGATQQPQRPPGGIDGRPGRRNPDQPGGPGQGASPAQPATQPPAQPTPGAASQRREQMQQERQQQMQQRQQMQQERQQQMQQERQQQTQQRQQQMQQERQQQMQQRQQQMQQRQQQERQQQMQQRQQQMQQERQQQMQQRQQQMQQERQQQMQQRQQQMQQERQQQMQQRQQQMQQERQQQMQQRQQQMQQERQQQMQQRQQQMQQERQQQMQQRGPGGPGGPGGRPDRPCGQPGLPPCR